MNDDMTRARPVAGEAGLEARAEPLFSLTTQLRQALQGAVYPLSVEQLVRVARENDGTGAVLTSLSGLPRREFRSLEEVQFALEG